MHRLLTSGGDDETQRLSEKGDRHPTSCASFEVKPLHAGASPPFRIGSQSARERYDAAVTAIDEGIRTLFGGLTLPDDVENVLFVVTSARGYSLGERGNVGIEPAVLHEEMLHIPLIVHGAQHQSDPFRTPQLTSPLDVHALLSCWLTADAGCRTMTDGPSTNWLLFSTAQGDRALRTPGWYVIEPSPEASAAAAGEGQAAPRALQQLYLKPDDRWEFNEILDRRPAIAAELSQRLDELLKQAVAGDPLSLPALPGELLKGG